MRGRDAFAPLRSPAFRFYLGARLASLFGNAIAPIALAFAVLDISDSATALGVVLAARTIPMLVFMLVGGVVADRFSRQRVLVVSTAVCFGSQALAAALVFAGVAEVWHLAVIEAVNGSAAAFFLPASTGIVPHLVPRAHLQQASALNGLTRSAAMIGGASIGGVVVGFSGPAWGLAADALTFGIAAVLLTRLRLPVIARPPAEAPWRELRVGWQEFASRRWLWLVVAAFGGLLAAHSAAWGTLGPVVADETFGRTSWGLISAAMAGGNIVGTTMLLRFRPRHPLRWGMVGMLAEAPLLFLLGLTPGVAQLVVAASIAGIGSAFFSVAWETSLQQHVPEDKLSRVSSYDALGSFIAIPVGQLLAGPLSESFGVREVVVGGAVVFTVFAAGPLLDASVRDLERADQVTRDPDHGAGGTDQVAGSGEEVRAG